MEEQNKDKMRQAVKSEINKQRTAQGKRSMEESYFMSAGGGTPAAGGGRGAMKGEFRLVASKEKADEIKNQDPKAKVRVAQPKDADTGQFLPNEVADMEITTKFSRGKGTHSFLDGIDLTFIKKGAEFQYEEKDEQGNSKLVRVISSIDLTADELRAATMKYLKDERGFAGIVGTAITKKGRTSKEEREGATGKTADKDPERFRESTKNKLDEASKNVDREWLQEQHERMEKAKQGKPEPEPAPAPEPKPEKEPVTTGSGSGNGSTKTSFDSLTDEQKVTVYNSVRETPGFENLSDRTISKMIQRGSIKLEDIVTPDKKKILEAMGL